MPSSTARPISIPSEKVLPFLEFLWELPELGDEDGGEQSLEERYGDLGRLAELAFLFSDAFDLGGLVVMAKENTELEIRPR